jgi:tetratricopeptide (TPR) repeat protein
VRALAARGLNPSPERRLETTTAISTLLDDPAAVVRITAAVSLISMGIHDLPGPAGSQLLAAQKMFRARAALNSDDADQDAAAGRFFLMLSDPASALKSLQIALKLDPQISVQYLLAGAYYQQGNMAEAKKILEAIPAADPQYDRAQRLLRQIH